MFNHYHWCFIPINTMIIQMATKPVTTKPPSWCLWGCYGMLRSSCEHFPMPRFCYGFYVVFLAKFKWMAKKHRLLMVTRLINSQLKYLLFKTKEQYLLKLHIFCCVCFWASICYDLVDWLRKHKKQSKSLRKWQWGLLTTKMCKYHNMI